MTIFSLLWISFIVVASELTDLPLSEKSDKLPFNVTTDTVILSFRDVDKPNSVHLELFNADGSSQGSVKVDMSLYPWETTLANDEYQQLVVKYEFERKQLGGLFWPPYSMEWAMFPEDDDKPMDLPAELVIEFDFSTLAMSTNFDSSPGFWNGDFEEMVGSVTPMSNVTAVQISSKCEQWYTKCWDLQELEYNLTVGYEVKKKDCQIPAGVETDLTAPVRNGDQISVTSCAPGYSLQEGGGVVTCIGGHLYDRVLCREDCTGYPVWNHFFLVHDTELELALPVPYGTVLQYKCTSSGYTRPSGDYSLTCMGGGQYNFASEPACEKSVWTTALVLKLVAISVGVVVLIGIAIKIGWMYHERRNRAMLG